MQPDLSSPPPAPETKVMSNVPQDDKQSHWKSILSTVGIFLLAPLVAIFLTAFVFQSYEVEGQSMEQTLQNHDRLIVYKLPKTFARLSHHTYMPARGEIVVFTKADIFPVATNERQLIKRVIGLPGDHVVVKNNKVTIYNSEHPDGFNPDADQNYSRYLPITAGNIDLTVQEGQVFVLGDNRTNSQDSRIFGPIDTKTINGTLMLRIYPFQKFHSY